uniref:Uncharacterized protein n=1 Tax=Globisporangium ultimum (strain ATCC 200006 / CBS 805.95 / DAOM BR144) TaxID=431595 RepID=K3WM67_GLOUD
MTNFSAGSLKAARSSGSYESNDGRTIFPKLPDATDEGLMAVARMPRIEHITISEAAFTAEGMLTLVQDTPDRWMAKQTCLKVGAHLNEHNTAL